MPLAIYLVSGPFYTCSLLSLTCSIPHATCSQPPTGPTPSYRSPAMDQPSTGPCSYRQDHQRATLRTIRVPTSLHLYVYGRPAEKYNVNDPSSESKSGRPSDRLPYDELFRPNISQRIHQRRRRTTAPSIALQPACIRLASGHLVL